MKIGISVPLPAYKTDPAFMAEKIEALGFDSIWYGEHPAVPVHSESPFPSTGGEIPWTYSHFTDPYIALARASAVTSRIKLATGVTLLPERNPLLLAKEVSALDLYSGGRFLFGIGTGWLKEETEFMGGDFPNRWTQTREALEVMKKLWSQEEAEHHGRYFDFPPVRSYPKPVQKPHPPILIGGMAKNVLRRVIDHGDGWIPNRVTPDVLADSRRQLDAMAADAGRDPEAITITVYGQEPDKALFNKYFEAGAERVVVRPKFVDSEEEMAAQLEDIARILM
jgi:probable F420-dependent oxidoreductase